MQRILILLLLSWVTGTAKGQAYTTARAHSHNDYEQARPFYHAFEEKFGSIEVDIYLEKGELLVGHSRKELQPQRTLRALYLDPLLAVAETNRQLQVLIDIKSAAIETLDTLLAVLQSYPRLTQNPLITFVISGNRPPEEKYTTYPPYIWFDGRVGTTYSPAALSRIALLSESIQKFTGLQQIYPADKKTDAAIRAAVESAHAMGKPIRFWATPDTPEAWQQLIQWQVDYINTDHILALRDYLRSVTGEVK